LVEKGQAWALDIEVPVFDVRITNNVIKSFICEAAKRFDAVLTENNRTLR
tara:strand:- start:262 stop:411 length:150 start_codon:yes stop_codon:yes gene_type:complete